MSLPFHPPSKPEDSVPFALRKRRTTVACSNCRQQKIKCRPRNGSVTEPCERCALRGLTCEYVPVGEQEEQMRFATDIPPVSTSSKSRGGRPGPPPLPYTAPPPPNLAPRYAGRPMPDLGLTSTQFAQPDSSFPGASQGFMDSRYSSPSLAGWSGSMPGPSPGTFPSTQSHPPLNAGYFTTHDGSYPGNPSFAPPSVMNQGYNLPQHQDAFNPHPATHHPGNYPQGMQFFDPASVPGPSSAQGPSQPYAPTVYLDLFVSDAFQQQAESPASRAQHSRQLVPRGVFDSSLEFTLKNERETQREYVHRAKLSDIRSKEISPQIKINVNTERGWRRADGAYLVFARAGAIANGVSTLPYACVTLTIANGSRQPASSARIPSGASASSAPLPLEKAMRWRTPRRMAEETHAVRRSSAARWAKRRELARPEGGGARKGIRMRGFGWGMLGGAPVRWRDGYLNDRGVGSEIEGYPDPSCGHVPRIRSVVTFKLYHGDYHEVEQH
ncbi:hypothetical protein FB451DRAFT_1467591 [Mycena latifolia]|nr:hypothetical protein FB451DRAFT_1467591 [Mycena latifolia]